MFISLNFLIHPSPSSGPGDSLSLHFPQRHPSAFVSNEGKGPAVFGNESLAATGVHLEFTEIARFCLDNH